MLVALWIMLPVLLVLSAIASGTETAMFSLGGKDRDDLAATSPVTARAVERLLAHPRRLLIMVLVFNMTINVLYFVVSTLLSYRAESPLSAALISTGAVLAIVLFGEVLAKVIASSRRVSIARIIAMPAMTILRLGSPLWVGLDRFVVAPLTRVVNPAAIEQRVDVGELTALVKRASGVLNDAESAILAEVVELRIRRAKDIMTPRIDLTVVNPAWTNDDLRAARCPFVAVSSDGLHEHFGGSVDVRRALMTNTRAVVDRVFVPEMATPDSVIGELGRKNTELVYVADERGDVTGMITLDDIVDELTAGAVFGEGATEIGPDLWRINGRMGVRDFGEEFSIEDIEAWVGQTRVSTIGGLVHEKLARIPAVGDRVEVGAFVFTVHTVRGRAAESLDVERAQAPEGQSTNESEADA